MPRNPKLSFENRDSFIALGLNIGYYRKRRGMTQEQLAEKADISRGYLAAIEAPNLVTNLTMEVFFTLAAALEVDPAKLLDFRNY